MVWTVSTSRFLAVAAASMLVAACNGEVRAAGDSASVSESAAVGFTGAVSLQTPAANALTGVQNRIKAAAEAAPEDGPAALEAVIADLESLEPGGAETLVYYRQYWLAYAKYQLSIERQRAGRIEDPEAPLQDAIALLEEIEPRDSEAHALYALAAGLNLQFVPRQEIMIAVGDVNASLVMALSRDADNVRGLYANALSDWNTPVEFGGRQRAETYLRQAVAVPAASSRPMAPTWGHDLAHALLVEVLLESDRVEEAEEVYEAAQAQFPDSAEIAELAGRF